MPLQVPSLDNRTYQDLLDEALARIPVHTPEWTNFNQSDPGVTLIEVSAFLVENLLYRCNLIPERNRIKFLQLLGIPLLPASSSVGLVTISNARGPLQTVTLNADIEVLAGPVPFRTGSGLDVLPIEGQVYYKRKATVRVGQLQNYYGQLYASFLGQTPDPSQLQLYETTLLGSNSDGIDLGLDTVDGSLWIALLARANDPPDSSADPWLSVRQAIAGKTINLGLVPLVDQAGRELSPGSLPASQATNLLAYQLPSLPAGGALPSQPSQRTPKYQTLATSEIPVEPQVAQITLPGDTTQLGLWTNLDPLEEGTGDFPPTLQDTNLTSRIITWLRLTSPNANQVKLQWAGINTVPVTQLAHVSGELLPTGNGEPDQSAVLANKSVIPKSVNLTVTPQAGSAETWTEIDDLLSAGPEVPVPDPRQPAGTIPVTNPQVKVFTVDPESGTMRFGDGTRGARPPFGATLLADYDFGVGDQGNVGPGSINNGPTLPAGFQVTNPVRTWGGAAPESVDEGQKQIGLYLQHRDRLVNAVDFRNITLRTPGVEIGRVEVIPAFNPQLAQNEPGDAPGAVTLLLIPKYDADHPDAPMPQPAFMNTICDYLDARRLVTTEVFLRAPSYKGVWISVGIKVVAGQSIADVREAVKQALQQFLSPLPPPATGLTGAPIVSPDPARANGWPLNTAVVDTELMVAAARVPGVQSILGLLLAEGTKASASQIAMAWLELPQILGISVNAGDPISIDQIRGQPTPNPLPSSFVPVPVIPDEC